MYVKFFRSTTLSREGGVTNYISVGIWISGSNTTSSLPVSIEVSHWAFGAFLPVHFPIVPWISSWVGVCVLDRIGIHLGRKIGSNIVEICLGMLMSVSSD